MADESGKSRSPTISSIAAPTEDIDSDWALDDDTEEAARPLAANAKGPHDEAQKSEPPATEQIVSEWSNDQVSAEQLKKPKIPAAPKLPEEAASFGAKSGLAPTHSASDAKLPSTTSAPAPAASYRPVSQSSIDKFERAATTTSKGAFGIGSSSAPPAAAASEQPEPPSAGASTASAPPVASAPPAASAPPVASAAKSSVAPAKSSTAPAALGQRDSESAPEPAKRKGSMLGLGLGAAAVAAIGIGLAFSSASGPERAIEREKSALAPDPASKIAPSPAPSPAAPVLSGAQAAPAPKEEPAAANDSETPAPSASAVADAAAEAAPATGEMLKSKINIYPDDAEIYHKGKLVGRGGAEVEVARGERKLLVLIRDGYYPRKLILDGKETTYNIGLRKQPSGSFLAGPSGGKGQKATGGTVAPATATAPAPAPPAPAPDKTVPHTPPTP